MAGQRGSVTGREAAGEEYDARGCLGYPAGPHSMTDWQLVAAWALVLVAIVVMWALLTLAALGLYRLVT